MYVSDDALFSAQAVGCRSTCLSDHVRGMLEFE